MARPPITPLEVDGVKMNYFEHLVNEVKPNFKELGIKLDFTGYKETIEDYSKLKDDDVKVAWRLSRDLNMWTEYFSDLSNTVNKLLLDSETDKMEQLAVSSFEADKTKVANGDRLANKDVRVVNARKKRNAYKAFLQELESKAKFVERAYYHCKATCDWNYSTGKNTPI